MYAQGLTSRLNSLPAMSWLTTSCLVAGSLLIAFTPIQWLIQSWVAPGYDSVGAVVFALVIALVLWSVTSAPSEQSNTPQNVTAKDRVDNVTWWLLGLCAVLRLIAQILDINVLGALLLCVDVYALARLAGLHKRARPVSPFWLGMLFCFCLPIEPLVQRVVGYGLQQFSAFLACGLLQPFDVVCDGLRLQLSGRDVLVDLPCSGSQLLSTIALVFCLLNALRPPPAMWVLPLGLLCLLLALFSNGLRIGLLALGISNGVDVMAPVPHALIGLTFVVLVTAALFTVKSRMPGTEAYRYHCDGDVSDSGSVVRLGVQPQIKLVIALVFFGFAAMVGGIESQPVDTSSPLAPPDVPLVAADFLAAHHELSDLEKQYFTQYGGAATRASYGPFGLLLVSTTSPLRHLHDPVRCFTAMGYTVERVGINFAHNATFFEVTSQAQERYAVYVSYLSETGEVATSIAEVVWRWMARPGIRWTMVQRIVPNHAIGSAATQRWQAALNRSFNLQTNRTREKA